MAWKSGYRDGTKFIHEHGLTRSDWDSYMKTPRQVLIKRVGSAYKAIKLLGLGGKKKLTDAMYEAAFTDYDEGFTHAANAIFDAMEGN